MRRHFALGSANIVDMSKVRFEAVRRPIYISDPIRVAEILRVSDISSNLFPQLVIGVRYWPWLLVARDFQAKWNDASRGRRVEADLEKIHQRMYTGSRYSFGNRGPRSRSTFRLYESMYRKISDVESAGSLLHRFLRKETRGFDGFQYHIFNHRNTNGWRKALRNSMGRPAKQFAAILNKLEKENGDLYGPEPAITRVLQSYLRDKSSVDEWLWKGCFCYALFRCLYGIIDPAAEKRKATKHDWHNEWVRLLKAVLKRKRNHIPATWYRFREHLRGDRPPFKVTHEKGERRRILRTFRFYTFFYLYCRSVPPLKPEYR